MEQDFYFTFSDSQEPESFFYPEVHGRWLRQNRTSLAFAKVRRMKAPSRFLNKSQGENLFKEAAGVERFEGGVWEHVEQLCFAYFVEIASLAGEKVKADGRTVIDLADVQAPEGSGGGPLSPEALLKSLHALAEQDVSQVAKFGKLITTWVEAQKAKT